MKRLQLPLTEEIAASLEAGEAVELNGEMITGRDAAHKRMYEAILRKDELGFELCGETLYYVGPCFMEDGSVISAGPTTSARMDSYAPALYDAGIIATIGKGDRGDEVYEAIKRRGGVYFAAIGGAGAIYGKAVEGAERICYGELGTEAVYRFKVRNFPVIVAIDCRGQSVYKNIDNKIEP